MKLHSLNQYHEDILKKYISFVQKTVYQATEGHTVKKFLDFNEVLENIIDFTNAFNKIVKSSNRRTEWAYLTPNLILYACVGFISGLRNKENNELMSRLSEDLFENTIDLIGETTDILEDMKIKEDMQKQILTNLNQINEHNN